MVWNHIEWNRTRVLSEIKERMNANQYMVFLKVEFLLNKKKFKILSDNVLSQ
jgi:hypothetical protein